MILLRTPQLALPHGLIAFYTLQRTILTKDYRSSTSATFSDHQAVSLTAFLQNKDFESEEGLMPWEINPGWRERREFGEKLAYAIGALEFMGETNVGIIMIVIILTGITMYLYS